MVSPSVRPKQISPVSNGISRVKNENPIKDEIKYSFYNEDYYYKTSSRITNVFTSSGLQECFQQFDERGFNSTLITRESPKCITSVSYSARHIAFSSGSVAPFIEPIVTPPPLPIGSQPCITIEDSIESKKTLKEYLPFLDNCDDKQEIKVIPYEEPKEQIMEDIVEDKATASPKHNQKFTFSKVENIPDSPILVAKEKEKKSFIQRIKKVFCNRPIILKNLFKESMVWLAIVGSSLCVIFLCSLPFTGMPLVALTIAYLLVTRGIFLCVIEFYKYIKNRHSLDVRLEK